MSPKPIHSWGLLTSLTVLKFYGIQIMFVLSRMSGVFIIYFFYSVSKTSFLLIIIVLVRRLKSKTLRTWLHILKIPQDKYFIDISYINTFGGEFMGSFPFLFFFLDHVLQILVVYRQYCALATHHKAVS